MPWQMHPLLLSLLQTWARFSALGPGSRLVVLVTSFLGDMLYIFTVAPGERAL